MLHFGAIPKTQNDLSFTSTSSWATATGNYVSSAVVRSGTEAQPVFRA
jgi:hypothetical protein